MRGVVVRQILFVFPKVALETQTLKVYEPSIKE
jgi:hypothetical protein